MSFPRYPRYKDSGVEWLGEVPEHWEVKPVSSIAEIVNGYPFDSRLFDANEGFPLVRIRDLDKAETEARYRGEFVDRAAVTACDVLIGMDGDFNVGRWRGIGTALLNQRMCCVRGSSDLVTDLLEYVLPIPLKLINDVTYSTTVKHLSSFQVEKIRVALPSTASDLGTLLGFLNHETAKIDALIAEQQRLIELLKEKRQAVISHAVTKGLNPDAPMKPSGVEWLGDVPSHWEVSQLRYIIRNGTTITYGIVQAGPHVEDGIPYIRTSDMSGSALPLEGYARTSSEIDAAYARSRVEVGDLVIAIRASVGKCLPVPPHLHGANLTQGTAKIAPGKRMARTFLLPFINSAAVQKFLDSVAKGATFKEITLEKLRKTPVLVPPMPEQNSIADYVREVEEGHQRLIGDAERAITLLQERRTALISAAVTGKIDVRGLAEAA